MDRGSDSSAGAALRRPIALIGAAKHVERGPCSKDDRMLGSIIRAYPALCSQARIRSEGIGVISTARVFLFSELASLSGSLEQCCGPYESGHLVPLP